MNPALVKARLRKGEETLRALRPVTLVWGHGDPRATVEAREGIANEAMEYEGTGFLEQREVKFYVLKELLPVPPGVTTVLEIQGRTEKWKVKRIGGGRSGNDVTWVFHCEEAQS